MSGAQEERRSFWRELIRQQEQSGLSVREFCRRRQASEPSFYEWRKRLAKEHPLKFALVEAESKAPAEAAAVEVTLATGEQHVEEGCPALPPGVSLSRGLSVGHHDMLTLLKPPTAPAVARRWAS